jgi:hypothetical protein
MSETSMITTVFTAHVTLTMGMNRALTFPGWAVPLAPRLNRSWS